MKKTVGLVGLFFVGVMLLLNPLTGVFGTAGVEFGARTDAAATDTAATTGEPPPVQNGQDSKAGELIDPSLTTSTLPLATTSVTEPDQAETIVTGPPVGTRFGDFQVSATIEDGVLVDIELLEQPGDRRSRQINNSAVPRYEQAAIAVQSADIDVITGATVTWGAYTKSLQAALDAAGS